jgi:hypothetical protein
MPNHDVSDRFDQLIAIPPADHGNLENGLV